MRARNALTLAVLANLALVNCAGVRTVNGFDTVETKSYCEYRVAICVIGAVAVVAAGVGIAVSQAGKHPNNRADAAFVLAQFQTPPRATSSTVGTTPAPVTATAAPATPNAATVAATAAVLAAPTTVTTP